jgi:SlyX protein
MPHGVDEALVEVQTKIAHLERAVNELSDVVFRQHKEIRALEGQVKAVKDKLQGGILEESNRTAEQERPPHY